jgi:CubicO group peptidase (beta-lactamase class C family)
VLLARAARKPLPHLMQERLFGPLGMKDTAFVASASQRARLVSAYRMEAGHAELYDAAATSLWNVNPAFPDAGLGLLSTADDYFAFSHLLLNQGRFAGRRLLSQAAVAAMTRDHLSAAQRAEAAPIVGDGRGWGFGVAVTTERTVQGLPAGAFGWNGGFGTSWIADPSSGICAILLTQTLFTTPVPPVVHQEFWGAVFSPAFL